MRRFSPYIITLTMLALLSLQACGPAKTQPRAGGGGSFEFITTGATVEVTDPDTEQPVTTKYTIAGARDVFETLSNEFNSSTDQFLAFSVKDIRVIPLDKNSKVVREKPALAQVQVDFKHMYRGAQTSLVFNAKLERDGSRLLAKGVRQEKYADFKNPFTANITCYDENCRLVEIRLARYVKKDNGELGEISGQIGALFSLSYPTVEVQRPDDGEALTNAQLKELERITTETVAIKTSVVIVNGPSFTRIAIPRLADPKNPGAKVNNLVEIETDLLDTSEIAPEVKKLTFEKAEPTVSARLAGNDPESGGLIVDFSVNDVVATTPPATPPPATTPSVTPPTPKPPVEAKKPAQTVRLIIQDNIQPAAPTQPKPSQPSPKMEREAPRAAVQTGMGMWRTSAGNKEGLDAASRLAGYATHPEVQKRVTAFVLNKKTFLTTIFSNAPLLSDVVEKTFESVNLTPELAYILNIESTYLLTGNATQAAKPTSANPNASAFGPWQIINSTANGINDLARDIYNLNQKPFYLQPVHNLKFDSNDDRGYFAQSTLMAALLLKSICEDYKNDPAVCILGYHGGTGVPQRAITKVDQKLEERITRYNITFAMIAKYRMADSKQISYVFDFLAYREIGQNPQKYNFHNVQPASTNIFKARLTRPSGFLPAELKL